VQPELLLKMGLNYPLAPWMLDPCDAHVANLLKMGIESADRITTVSKSYHSEILKGHNAFNLDKTLIAHRHKFLGILNGIDYDYFNPGHDPHLACQFSKKCFNNLDALIQAKNKNLEAICKLHKKPFDTRFTVCSITRLAEQKAPQLIMYTLKKTIELGGRFILVGSLHGCSMDDEIIRILKDYENHPYVIAELNTNAEMAHLTYAGSNALVVPSLFEPCGLTQLIAMRYGTIPMVRATGGLRDTVFDVDTSDLEEEKRNGFTFDYPDQGGIDWVLTRAYKLFSETNELFYSLALKNLKEDHSWNKAVEGYLEIYAILGLNSKN
jgi:starch synthase